MSGQTLKKLASGAKVSERTVNSWVKRGCPRTSVAAVLRWKAIHVLPRKGGPRKPRSNEDEEDLGGYHARRVAAEAKKAEQAGRKGQRENDVAERLLVPKAEITLQWAEQFSPARTLLDAFPDQFAKEAPRELRVIAYELARNAIDKVLRGLARIGTDPNAVA